MNICEARLLLDRVFSTGLNMEMMVSEGLGFTTPMPNLQKIAKEFLSETNREIENLENKRLFNQSLIRMFESKVSVGDNMILAITYLDEITNFYHRLDGLETHQTVRNDTSTFLTRCQVTTSRS